ncbi:hypothetical protein ACOMHN_051891 [Nucella lapillus]
MPAIPLTFRPVCGQFAAVVVGFMLKRAKFQAAMRILVLTLTSGAHGVMVGVILSLLYMGILLHPCGYVELNPGPSPKTGKTRQSRLGSATGASRRGSVDMQESTSPTTPTPAADPTSIEHVVMNNLSNKFAVMCNDMKELKKCLCQSPGRDDWFKKRFV